ncbi:MAG TPA: kinase [Gammaproteobacteria bacterium]|nr:kinase [Gammaproteobacteria bacterium]
MSRPSLYLFAGLPGVGKTTLAQALARASGLAYLRIDTMEQALRDLCHLKVEGEGYSLAYRVASDNLRQGVSVIADSCNPIALTRKAWRQVAVNAQANCVNIEVICSDLTEHRRRVNNRTSTIKGLQLPTWEQVEQRTYQPWQADRRVIDTAGKSAQESIAELLGLLALGDDKISPQSTEFREIDPH